MEKSFMLQKQRVDIVTTIIIIGFVLAVFFHYCMGAYLHLPYPMNTFLFNPWDKFNDLFNVLKMGADFNPYQPKIGLEPAIYFPFMYVFLYAFLKLFSLWVILYFLVVALLMFISVINVYLSSKLKYSKINILRNTFVLTLMSYPVLFDLDRANLETFLFIILASSLIFFYKKYYYLANVFLAIAIAMKVYPAIFLVLFLKEKKIKPLIFCVLSAVILTVFSLFILGDNFMQNIKGLIFGLNYYHSTYIIGNAGLFYGNSVFGAIKVTLSLFSIPFDLLSLDKYMGFFSLFIFIFIRTFIYFRKMAFWQQLAIIVCTYLVFIPGSPAYRLLALYIPLWFFFLDENITQKKGIIYSILFGFLFIPKQYMPELFAIMNPLLLMLFLFLLLCEGSGLVEKIFKKDV